MIIKKVVQYLFIITVDDNAEDADMVTEKYLDNAEDDIHYGASFNFQCCWRLNHAIYAGLITIIKLEYKCVQ